MNYSSTSIDFDYSNTNPLRKRLDQYRKRKMSETTWRKVKSLWERKVQNDWVVSGGSMFDDWLDMHGQKYIEQISRDMDMKGDWYGI